LKIIFLPAVGLRHPDTGTLTSFGGAGYYWLQPAGAGSFANTWSGVFGHAQATGSSIRCVR